MLPPSSGPATPSPPFPFRPLAASALPLSSFPFFVPVSAILHAATSEPVNTGDVARNVRLARFAGSWVAPRPGPILDKFLAVGLFRTFRLPENIRSSRWVVTVVVSCPLPATTFYFLLYLSGGWFTSRVGTSMSGDVVTFPLFSAPRQVCEVSIVLLRDKLAATFLISRNYNILLAYIVCHGLVIHWRSFREEHVSKYRIWKSFKHLFLEWPTPLLGLIRYQAPY